MAKPKVLTAIPIHRYWSHESQDYFLECVRNAKNWEALNIFKLYEESLIQRARNTCLEAFLKSGADYLFFLDDDIVLIEPNSIDKLVAANVPIIGGSCVVKKPPYRPNFYPLTPTYPDLRGRKQILRVEYLGTSCMLITRKTAEAVKEKYDYPFDCFVNDKGVYLSEDWAFCDRANKLGFYSYIEPSVSCGHIGQYVYSMNDYYIYNNIGGEK